MIGWGFLLLVAFVLAWLFTESRATRGLAFGALTVIAGLVASYFLFFQPSEGIRSGNLPVSGHDRKVVENQRVAEQSRFALQVNEIAMLKRNLLNGTTISWDNEGNKVEQPDLSSWTFSGDIQNTSNKYTAKDVTFDIRLYSCPDYFTTSIAEVQLVELTRNCNPVGDSNLTLYGIHLKPGEIKSFSEKFKINNQREPRNWRFWADVSRVITTVK